MWTSPRQLILPVPPDNSDVCFVFLLGTVTPDLARIGTICDTRVTQREVCLLVGTLESGPKRLIFNGDGEHLKCLKISLQR